MQDNNGWISLLSFSAKYGVSLSTLRRRIKENSIEYQLEAGKYLLRDNPFDFRRRSPIEGQPEDVVPVFQKDINTSIIDDIKMIYDRLLQEKDLRIAQLNEEVMDLKMLVKILENQTKSEADLPPPTPEKEKFFVPTLPEDFFFEDSNKK